jgi:hypothetical protein
MFMKYIAMALEYNNAGGEKKKVKLRGLKNILTFKLLTGR